MHIRDWVGELAAAGVTGSYAMVIYSSVRSVLSAAVDDGHLPKKPVCGAVGQGAGGGGEVGHPVDG